MKEFLSVISEGANMTDPEDRVSNWGCFLSLVVMVAGLIWLLNYAYHVK